MRTQKGLKPIGSNADMDTRGMPLGTKVWAYLRHSPGDNQTLESREAAIRNLVKEKNWIIDRVFQDAGISGKSVDIEWMVHLANQKPRRTPIQDPPHFPEALLLTQADC